MRGRHEPTNSTWVGGFTEVKTEGHQDGCSTPGRRPSTTSRHTAPPSAYGGAWCRPVGGFRVATEPGAASSHTFRRRGGITAVVRRSVGALGQGWSIPRVLHHHHHGGLPGAFRHPPPASRRLSIRPVLLIGSIRPRVRHCSSICNDDPGCPGPHVGEAVDLTGNRESVLRWLPPRRCGRNYDISF